MLVTMIIDQHHDQHHDQNHDQNHDQHHDQHHDQQHNQTQVEHLLALLSRHSRECFECQCNNLIYKQLDFNLHEVFFFSFSSSTVTRRWRRTRTRSWPTWRATTSTPAQNLSPSLTLDRLLAEINFCTESKPGLALHWVAALSFTHS